jgi:hypothetical protein
MASPDILNQYWKWKRIIKTCENPNIVM